MDPEISAEALRALFAQLSDRQAEVLRLHAAHRTAKEIARDLGISEYTVRAHATEARKRLGAGTLREAFILLARFDSQSGLVSNWQSQPEGIASGDIDRAGLANGKPSTQYDLADTDGYERPPEPEAPVSLIVDVRTPVAADTYEVVATAEAVSSFSTKADQHHRTATSVLLWVHTRFKTLTGPHWLILLGVSTLLVLMITVGVLAGAGAVLQTIQDLGVRAR